MVAAAMKQMALNFAKLNKFEGVDFRRWQKKMHFLLSSMSVVYVLTTPMPEDVVMMQPWNKSRRGPSRTTMTMSAQEKLTLVELGSHLRIKESLRMQDSDKPKSNNVAGPLINIVNDNIASAFMSTFKLNDSIIWTESRVLREVVRLPDPKLKTLGKRGIECIFVGYVEHSKAFRFYVIEPNDSVSINSITESRDAIFDENRFSSVPRPSLRIPNETEVISGSVVPEEVIEEVVQQPEPELRKSKRNRTPKDFGPEFQLYLIEGTRDEVSDQHSYCFNVEDDPKTFDEAMKSQDVAFWKEAINDEMDSIMGNNTWVLADLPPGWSFMSLNKTRIDYFDTYAPVARISTIRLLIAMASIHNLIIHQMDVKTAFLNGKLEEEVYMNQPQGFIIPGNENKVCKLIKSLYGLKQAPKQWHQKFDEVVLSNGYLLNQADRFFMKDMWEADVILGIRIKQESNGISISQSHYIEKVLKKFNYFDCTPVSTPMDTSVKLMPNNGQAVSQLEYSRYSALASNSEGTEVLEENHELWIDIYTGYPLVLEGYTDASWVNNTEDNSSTSGWVFLLGGGVISWAFKKQTCITGSTMESEFVALVTAGKEAEWLENLLLEISLWSKPITHISIRCDSVATLANAYSQMYNGKSRHLGVRHSMIRELITNGVISIEFVRSQQNLVDHLTKGLARDLVIKSAERMGLKFN
ncbi:zinc finger, CCHC-type containing protein [Tanacetum coccineum]